ncbi:hypothetical protein QNM99_11950 [Pseudomonas sp. PCH446]
MGIISSEGQVAAPPGLIQTALSMADPALGNATVTHRFSLTSRMTLFIFIMCAVLVGSDIWRSFTARSVQLGEMTTATANLARAMAQHADDTIKEADLVLSGIVERVQHDGTAPPVLERLHQLFSARLSELPQLDGLYLFDRNGELIASSSPGHCAVITTPIVNTSSFIKLILI